jgi:hypothetical protein
MQLSPNGADVSNHLQRIASAIIGPAAPRLRPMLGSIFAPISSDLSSVAHPPQVNEPFVPSTPIEGQAGALHHSQESPLLSASHVPMPGAGFAQSSYRPGVTERDILLMQHHDVSPAPEPSLFPHAAHDKATAHGAAGAQPPLPQSPNRRGDAADRPAPAPALQHTQTLIKATASPSRAIPARSAPDGPARQARREHDEIHIHIGRIEVAAITPSAPRPAPPPARKTLSLEDYLRRGNGRQG